MRANADKCLQPNPDHCGRSPTVHTLAYLPALQLSGQLFARKFSPEVGAAPLPRALGLMFEVS